MNRLIRPLFIIVLCLLGTLSAIASAKSSSAIQISNERRISFNDNWRFHKGEAAGAENSSFDDSQWIELRLPHDWAIEGPFDPKANPHTGALPISGTGWYRKTFTLPDRLKKGFFTIEFD